jgi:hypothetical protein
MASLLPFAHHKWQFIPFESKPLPIVPPFEKPSVDSDRLIADIFQYVNP